MHRSKLGYLCEPDPSPISPQQIQADNRPLTIQQTPGLPGRQLLESGDEFNHPILPDQACGIAVATDAVLAQNEQQQ